jgi:hypothetical protein
MELQSTTSAQYIHRRLVEQVKAYCAPEKPHGHPQAEAEAGVLQLSPGIWRIKRSLALGVPM